MENCHVLSFSFLTDKHLLLSVGLSLYLERNRNDIPQWRLVICDIERTSQLDRETDLNSYVATAEFYVPPFHRRATFSGFSISSDPPPCALSELNALMKDDYTVDSSTKTNNSVPFTISARDRLFVVKAAATINEDLQTPQHNASGHFGTFFPHRRTAKHICIFIPLSTFVPYLLSPKPSAIIYSGFPDTSCSDDKGFTVRGHARRDVAVKWEDWIPSGTRILILPRGRDDVWVRDVYGMKYLHVYDSSRRSTHVVVFDFNSPAVLRNAQRETDESEDENEEVEDKTLYSRDMIHPSTIEANHIFSVDVTTSIPYRIACSKEKHRSTRLMISEDNIVLVNVS